MSKKLEIKIKAEDKSLTNTFGKFIVEPLERGYGMNDVYVENPYKSSNSIIYENTV